MTTLENLKSIHLSDPIQLLEGLQKAAANHASTIGELPQITCFLNTTVISGSLLRVDLSTQNPLVLLADTELNGKTAVGVSKQNIVANKSVT